MKDAIERGVKATGGGLTGGRTDAGTGATIGGSSGSGSGTTGGGTTAGGTTSGGTTSGGTTGGGTTGGGTGDQPTKPDKPGTPTTPPVKPPAATAPEQLAWYQFRWVIVRRKVDCRYWTQTLYNNAYIRPSEVPQYIDYVKRDLPTLPLPNNVSFVSGTVTQVAGPVAKEPPVADQTFDCRN
jgi:hypothetical protein